MLDLDLLLRLQHLSDSALPVGGLAHSFGLESLVDAGALDLTGLQTFLTDYIQTGCMEAWYCAAAWRSLDLADWATLNVELAARKPARESREGSAAMGRRFLQLSAEMTGIGRLLEASTRTSEVHLAPAFGLVAAAIGIEVELAAAAFLHQSIATLVSCCQRLLPLGQHCAQRILWDLKPGIGEAVRFAVASHEARSFTPFLDIASARHPNLQTRLFIS